MQRQERVRAYIYVYDIEDIKSVLVQIENELERKNEKSNIVYQQKMGLSGAWCFSYNSRVLDVTGSFVVDFLGSATSTSESNHRNQFVHKENKTKKCLPAKFSICIVLFERSPEMLIPFQ